MKSSNLKLNASDILMLEKTCSAREEREQGDNELNEHIYFTQSSLLTKSHLVMLS